MKRITLVSSLILATLASTALCLTIMKGPKPKASLPVMKVDTYINDAYFAAHPKFNKERFLSNSAVRHMNEIIRPENREAWMRGYNLAISNRVSELNGMVLYSTPTNLVTKGN